MLCALMGSIKFFILFLQNYTLNFIYDIPYLVNMPKYPPSHFKDWNPIVNDNFSKFNKTWASNEKFKHLGEVFEEFLQSSIKNLETSRLFIDKNRPNTRGGTYLYKRFVRIFPKGYHPNGLQIFIECFSGNTKRDGNRRDSSDYQYNDCGFPIPDGCLGIYIGMSAISHFKDGQQWGMEDCIYGEDSAREIFFELEERVNSAKEWALQFTGSTDDFVTVQNDRVQRIRIKLPDLDINSSDWEDCRLSEGLAGLIEHFGDVFFESVKE